MNPKTFLSHCVRVTLVAAAFNLSGCGHVPTPAETAKSKAVVEDSMPALAASVQSQKLSPDAQAKLFAYYLTQHPEVYGVAFAQEPAPAGSDPRPVPYVYRSWRSTKSTNLAKPDYDYSKMEWFTAPVAQKSAVWTDPYFDKGGGNIWMVTYSYPIYADAAKTQLYGVLTNDVPVAKPAPAPKAADAAAPAPAAK